MTPENSAFWLGAALASACHLWLYVIVYWFGRNRGQQDVLRDLQSVLDELNVGADVDPGRRR